MLYKICVYYYDVKNLLKHEVKATTKKAECLLEALNRREMLH